MHTATVSPPSCICRPGTYAIRCAAVLRLTGGEGDASEVQPEMQLEMQMQPEVRGWLPLALTLTQTLTLTLP